jgi:chromosome segregation ATPase
MEDRGLATASAQPRDLARGVDAHSQRRENRRLAVDPQADLLSEIARLTGAIDRAAVATETVLGSRLPALADDDPRSPLPEHKELSRQLAALRERVALAEHRNEGSGALRAELATLWCFARTLQADAENWRAALDGHIEELERQRTAAREEHENLAAELEKLRRRRDALQLTILQTGARMAQQYRGECRRTVPVVTLGEGLTVCSVSVSCPRRGLRFARQWLVAPTRSHGVLITRE